uniref:Uncharacterized protein n=1 Tax=Setaria italica TaxID=4555 RepID=K3YLC9_SETIT
MVCVYGSLDKNIITPLLEKCALFKKLLADMINSHRDGLSWEGDIDTGDEDVYDDKVSIAKEPKSFPIRPKISLLMDKTFIRMLSGMASYDSWWSNTETAESLRELIENHPFLKPDMTRSNLWSGIFCAYSSHDAEDLTSKFKTVITSYGHMAWTGETQENRMLRCVFKYKNKKSQPSVTAGRGADGPAAGPAASTVGSAAGADGPAAGPTASTVGSAAGHAASMVGSAAEGPWQADNLSGYDEENAAFLIEYLRHLFHHGSGYSFASGGAAGSLG